MKISDLLTFLLLPLASLNLSAAEYIEPTKTSPAKIVIKNATKKFQLGQEESLSIELIALDKKGLHFDQIYRAKFLGKGATSLQENDGFYHFKEGYIFIPEIKQADILRHQITLKHLKGNDFAVIENTISAIPSKLQPQFKSVQIQPVNYTFPPQLKTISTEQVITTRCNSSSI